MTYSLFPENKYIVVEFYENYMHYMLFIFCHLIFKNSPNKKVYIHVFIVFFVLYFKHIIILLAQLMNFKNDHDIDRIAYATAQINDYFVYSILTSLISVMILALMHRPSNMSYDTLLKKEIWGVWYQENNSTDYFERKK